MSIKCNKTICFLGLILNCILIIMYIVMQCNALFSIMFLLWSNMMLYCCNRIYNRILLFCFGTTFFVFLIGRDAMEQLFNHNIETNFANDVNNHAYLSMIISLTGIWITYIIFNHVNVTKQASRIDNSKYSYIYYIRKYSKLCFFLTYPFAVGLNLAIAIFVMTFGYYSLYTDFSGILESNPLFYLIDKIGMIMPASFSIFMATLPTRKEFKKLSVPYIIYLIITLGSGQRGAFLVGLLIYFIFLMYMQQLKPNEQWFNKKYFKVGIICIPFIAISASYYNNIRFGESNEDKTVTNSFTDFFYDQGVSINVVKRAYELEESIPKQKDYYVFEFLHSGILARILGNPVYQGNTIEHATKGGSFVHAIGYTIMGSAYLAGAGPGSSYIAELYYDFGYIGVFIGSCLYGYIFTLINNFKSAGIFRRSLTIMIIGSFLFAPRAGFASFVSFLLAPTTIALLIFVFCAAQISYVDHRKLKETNIALT